MSAQGKDPFISNDGGPAFPHVNPNYDGNWDKEPQRAGMSLRDFFAGQALIGQLSFSPHDSFEKAHYPSDVASLAYRFADAMLKEREK